MTTENPPSIPASRRARHRRSVIARPAPAQHHHRLHVAPIPHPSHTHLAQISHPALPQYYHPEPLYHDHIFVLSPFARSLPRPAHQLKSFTLFLLSPAPFRSFLPLIPTLLVVPPRIFNSPPTLFFATVLDLFVAVLHLFAAAHRLRALFDSVSLFLLLCPALFPSTLPAPPLAAASHLCRRPSRFVHIPRRLLPLLAYLPHPPSGTPRFQPCTLFAQPIISSVPLHPRFTSAISLRQSGSLYFDVAYTPAQANMQHKMFPSPPDNPAQRHIQAIIVPSQPQGSDHSRKAKNVPAMQNPVTET